MNGTDIAVIDPREDPQWNSWLEKIEASTIFHSANWATLLAETYGYRPLYFTLSGSSNYRGCLPVMEVRSVLTGKRGVCLSFSDFCGTIAQNEGDFKKLLHAVLEYGRSRKWRYMEFRGECFLEDVAPVKEFIHHGIPLDPDEGVMLSRLRKSTARGIQKAIKEGVKVEISSSADAVRQFYKLHCLTRKRQGLPPQPQTYFLKLHQHLISKKQGFVALASFNDNVIAGVVCLHFGRNAIYKYGASDTQEQHLRPNNLLFWEIIKKCSSDGFGYLSLGRTDLENDGLVTFKDGWGGKRTTLKYHKYDFTTEAFSSEEGRRFGNSRIFKALPIPVLRMIGALAYRHMG